MLSTVCLAAAQVAASRFQPVAPFSGLPYVTIDQRWAGGSFTDEACRRNGLQGRVLWVDGTANLDAVSSAARIASLLERVKSVGFNTVVLDVKPIVGRTLYPSKLTAQMTAWKGQTLPAGFDPARVFRDETSRLGLSFFVSMNAFSEGHSYAKRDEGKADSQFGDPGWGYRNPDLQSVLYDPESGKFVRALDGPTQIPLMMNPHHPEVQQRVLAFVEEVVSRYRPDGLLFDDRYRFHSLAGDFSEAARAEFEKRVRAKLVWPDDVFVWTHPRPGVVGVKPGRYFDAWLAWRAQSLGDFASRVRAKIRAANPGTLFGIYAGSWYGDYAKYGSNYASDALQAGFPFLTNAYRRAGLAANLDVLITGCYYKTPTMFDALGLGKPIGQTVEAAADVSNRVARDRCWVYAGIQMADFKDDLSGFSGALQAAAATTQGVMVFDLSHNANAFWPTFERAFAHPANAPHSRPDLLGLARTKREKWDKAGYRERPFPILEGAPGTGF